MSQSNRMPTNKRIPGEQDPATAPQRAQRMRATPRLAGQLNPRPRDEGSGRFLSERQELERKAEDRARYLGGAPPAPPRPAPRRPSRSGHIPGVLDADQVAEKRKRDALLNPPKPLPPGKKLYLP